MSGLSSKSMIVAIKSKSGRLFIGATSQQPNKYRNKKYSNYKKGDLTDNSKVLFEEDAPDRPEVIILEDNIPSSNLSERRRFYLEKYRDEVVEELTEVLRNKIK